MSSDFFKTSSSRLHQDECLLDLNIRKNNYFEVLTKVYFQISQFAKIRGKYMILRNTFN